MRELARSAGIVIGVALSTVRHGVRQVMTRPAVQALLFTCAGVAVATVTPLISEHRLGVRAATGAAVGIGAWMTVRLYSWLRKLTDRFTALAGTAVVAGTVSAILTAAPPSCPVDESGSRCSVEDVAAIGLVGALMPVTVAVFVYPPAMLVRNGRRAVRLARRLQTRTHDSARPGPGGVGPGRQNSRKSDKRTRRRS